jgi:hypothetical protein
MDICTCSTEHSPSILKQDLEKFKSKGFSPASLSEQLAHPFVKPCTKLASVVGDPPEAASSNSITSAMTMGCTEIVNEAAAADNNSIATYSN